jgi:hypothetical protein
VDSSYAVYVQTFETAISIRRSASHAVFIHSVLK